MDLSSTAPRQIPIRELAIRYHKEGRFAEAIKAYRVALLLFPRDTVLSYNLGNLFRQIDQAKKAIACYELVLRLNPEELATLSNLAPLYRNSGEHDKAIRCYQKILELQPSNQTAQYFLAALEGKTPLRSPDAYVTELFDRYAPSFEQHITQALQYRAPQLLRELWLACGTAAKHFPRAFDLGCGTGLGASAFRQASSCWEGVDLSAAMLLEAERKGLYQKLYQQEILSFIEEPHPPEPALVLMTDVLPYFGDLTALFQGLARRLAKGSCLVFSTEEGLLPIELPSCGRYRHSFAYVYQTATAYGFVLSGHRLASSRLQAGAPVPAGLFCFTKETNLVNGELAAGSLSA